MSDVPQWEQRFRAPTLAFPHWARHAPQRLAVASNESGAWQVYAWDRDRDTRHQVTDDPIGVDDGFATPDGEAVVWFEDATGDEVGRWVKQPFHGDGSDNRPLVPGVPDAWSTGLSVGDGIVAASTAGDDGFTVYVSEAESAARVLHRHTESVGVRGLARDSALLCLEHAEHGDNIHPALRVVDARSGETVGEQWDGPGKGLAASRWAPVAGDQRLAVVHELDERERPAVWDVAAGERTNLIIDVPGDVSVADWWPDAASLILVHEHEGRHQLLRFDLASGTAAPLAHPTGTISGAGVRPDGDIWYRIASGSTPASIRSLGDGDDVCVANGPRAPEGQPYRSWSFTNPVGQRVHGFVATPPSPAPHQTVMLIHGGPTWAYTDSFMPHVQAWVDHGLAVAMVNYRGSTGYGVEFRDALIGNPGFPEVEDLVAGLDELIDQGITDPSNVVVAGASWGGYVTLLALGLHPDRWAVGVADVPVADYVTAYRDEAPSLQAFDRSLFGGSPDEVGNLYKERSPLSYVGNVQAPVLVIAGDNDSRCPIQQVLNYVEALKDRGHPVELYRFDAGHGSMVTDEEVRQMAAELAFVLPRLNPPAVVDGA